MSDDYLDYTGTAPIGEVKPSVHRFLRDVVMAKDTTKIGNLTSEEVGAPKLPLRTCKELELFCRNVLDQETFADYFRAKGEILAATSLSKDAKLITLAVIQKREVADVTHRPVVNKGWFKKKNPEVEATYG